MVARDRGTSLKRPGDICGNAGGGSSRIKGMGRHKVDTRQSWARAGALATLPRRQEFFFVLAGGSGGRRKAGRARRREGQMAAGK